MHIVKTILRILAIALVGAFFSVLALVSLPFDQKGVIYFWSGSTWSKFILWICNIHLIVRGRENISMNGNYIFVTNHASMFDIPSVLATLPRVRIMFKKELSHVPVWGWALRWGHHIMVDRGKGTEAMKSLERAAGEIRRGGSVILFAEGTRTRDGKLQPFKRGAFSLAAKSGVPIVPIAISGSFRILPKKSLDIRPSTIEFAIDVPIETAGINTREGEIDLMNRTRSVIERYYREDVQEDAGSEKNDRQI
jgi:1-acyl-sn-glycerol-3-phosphate acyltransferase